jgi:GNAT superfamily N-acetyltransferase
MREDDIDSPEIRAFSCGSNPWDEEVATFLRSSEAWRAHRSGKSATMLYFTNEREESLVGFFNIAKRTVGYPHFKGARRVPCFLITFVAVSVQHQGNRYFSRMLEDIVRAAPAAEMAAIYLLVDERNNEAITRYKRKGFVPFSDAEPYVDPATGTTYQRMVLSLVGL